MNDIRKTLQQSKNALEQYLELWYDSGKFIVIIEGIPIRCRSPRKTFNQAIKTLGVEEVYNLCIRTPKKLLISDKSGPQQDIEIAPGRYIQTAISNEKKAEILLDIAESLSRELFIIDTDLSNKLIAAWRTRKHGKYINDKLYVQNPTT